MSLKKYQHITNLKKAREQGFTIVELLIVIIVIAILAALVITAYTGVQARAKDSARKSAAKSVQVAAEGYASANSGAYPTLTTNAAGGIKHASNPVKLDGSIVFGTAASGTPDNIGFTACGSGAGVTVTYWQATKSGGAGTETFVAGTC